MSELWPLKKLGEICDVSRGKTITRKQTQEGDVPVVAGGISNSYSHNTANRPANVITVSGSGANAGYVNFWPIPIFASDCSTILPLDPNVLDVRFIYYAMLNLQDYISTELRRGAAQPHVYAKDLALLEISLPPLVEQQRIVSILDEAFENIKVGKSQVLKKFHDGEELFQSILNSILFPDNNNWEQTTIEESCNYRNGKAHEKDIHENGKYIVVNSKYISRDGTIKKYTNNLICPLHIDEIAMVLSDVPNGKALAKCILIDQEEKYSLNQRISAISSEHFIPKYLFFQLNRNRHFLSFNNGENQTNLRKNQVVSCPLFKPSIDEQISIVEKLESLTEAHLLLMQKLLQEEECFINLEKSILEDAFNGKLAGGIAT